MAITINITEKAPATAISASLVAGGSLVVGTTYYYKMVAVEYVSSPLANYVATAFSAHSAEASFTPTAGNQSIKLDWTAPAKINGAHLNGYLILRTTTSGNYSSSTAKLLNAAPGLGSAYATTTADVITFTDDGTRTLNKCATYTLGVPKVSVDTSAGAVVTEELIYQAYVTAGKTQFAQKSEGQRGVGVQYYLCGMFKVGYSGACNLTFTAGTEVLIDGTFDTNPISATVITMGSSTTPGGSTLGFLGCVNDAYNRLRGTLNLYNSKIYDAGHLLGLAGNTGYYSGNSFQGVLSLANSSVIKNCQILTYNGNVQVAGPMTVSGTLLELNPRHESGAGDTPVITDATIYGGALYTYSSQYVLNKRCVLLSNTWDLYFHGASLTWRRYIDIIDFTPFYEPPRGAAITNPTTAIYNRKWSLNIKATDVADAPLQNVAVGVLDKNGMTSVFVDSGTKTSTAFLAQAATSLVVLDGTKVAVNDAIRIAAELMLVTAKATNTLTVTRGYAGSFANDYNMQHSFTVWVQKDVALSSALGVIEEQYMMAETYQGNAALASPYQYDTVTYTPHTITISKYGYQRVTITQAVAAPVKISQRLLADAHIVASEATAGAYTGIAVNQSTGTITLTAAHTIDELYDYVQWWASRDANLRYAIPMTTTDGVTYALDYDLVINGCLLTGNGHIAMAAKALTLISAGSSTIGITHSAGVLTTINITGYTVGARLQVFDTVDVAEIYNGVPSGTTLTLVKNWAADHLLRIRMARVVGVDADALIQTYAIFSQTGAQVLLTPSPDSVYEANAIDGSTVTEFTADFPNVQIDVNDPDGTTTPQRGYAWYMSGQMTADGIAGFHGGMSADDALNYRINASVLDMRVQNVSTAPCVITGARIYRDDGSSIFAAGSGPIQSEPGKAYIAPGESAAIAAGVLAAAQVAPIHADVRKINGTAVIGDGTPVNLWRA